MAADGIRLRWLSGPTGASWLTIDRQLAELIESVGPGVEIEVVPGGGRENIDKLRDGSCDIVTSVGFLAAAAHRGEPPYRPERFTSLRTLNLDWNRLPFHIIRARDVTPADLQTALRSPGLRIGVPPESTSDELAFRHVLDICHVSCEALVASGGLVRHDDYENLAEGFVTGEIDYFFGATAAPAATLKRLGDTRGAELIPAGTELISALRSLGYTPGHIAASTYPRLQTQDISTFMMSSTLLTRQDLPGEVAAEIVHRLVDNADHVRRIHPSLIEIGYPPRVPDNGVPRHEGLDTIKR